MIRRLALTAALAVVGLTLSAESAQAQFRRGPVGRVLNSLPVPPGIAWYYGVQRPNVVIVQPPAGSPGQPGTTGSAAKPMRDVQIKVVLPVAGATIAVNGIDFGKTEYFERKLAVSEPLDDPDHDFTIDATWTANGKEVKQSRKVSVGKSGKATANFLVDEPKK
jgi:hypothetical protein